MKNKVVSESAVTKKIKHLIHLANDRLEKGYKLESRELFIKAIEIYIAEKEKNIHTLLDSLELKTAFNNFTKSLIEQNSKWRFAPQMIIFIGETKEETAKATEIFQFFSDELINEEAIREIMFAILKIITQWQLFENRLDSKTKPVRFSVNGVEFLTTDSGVIKGNPAVRIQWGETPIPDTKDFLNSCPLSQEARDFMGL